MPDSIPQVLLIEDSETQALKLVSMFELKGWEASWCETAEKGLLYLEEHMPDLILVDYMLPGMQGDAFCRMVRIKRNTRNIPMLMVTSLESANPREWVMGSGANDLFASSEDYADTEVFDALFERAERLLKQT